MDSGVDIPWIGGVKIPWIGVDISCEEGSKYHG